MMNDENAEAFDDALVLALARSVADVVPSPAVKARLMARIEQAEVPRGSPSTLRLPGTGCRTWYQAFECGCWPSMSPAATQPCFWKLLPARVFRHTITVAPKNAMSFQAVSSPAIAVGDRAISSTPTRAPAVRSCGPTKAVW
jgi:hypothetical protein